MNIALKKIQGFIIDLDGTTYIGNTLVDGSIQFYNKLIELNLKKVIITNNSSADARAYSKKLQALGISVSENEILTSGSATCMYLKIIKPGARIFPLGTKSLEEELKNYGFILTDKAVDFVVLGFDKTLTYKKLETATLLIRDGVEYIATHLDLVCPTERGLIPDCGSISALIKAATGKEPKIVIGKPNKQFIDMAAKKMSLDFGNLAIIGDRLYTDILMAKRAGIFSILVLSGISNKNDVKKYRYQPDMVIESIGELTDLI